MLLVFILFVLFSLGTGFVAYFVTAKALKGRLLNDGVSQIAEALRKRNRLVVAVLFLVASILAAIEAFVPDWHSLMLDLQYAATITPFGVQTFGTGAGVSWGLYAGVLLGVLIGLYVGTYRACQNGPRVSPSVRATQLV